MESTVPKAGAIRSNLSLDRAIATIASLPFAWMAYYRLVVQGVDLPRAAMAINYALLIVTILRNLMPQILEYGIATEAEIGGAARCRDLANVPGSTWALPFGQAIGRKPT